MGSDKALLPWPPVADRVPFSGETFLSAAIRSLSSATDQVVVVVGANEAQLAPVVYAAGGSLVRNPAPEAGQFSSLRVGLQEVLNLGRDAAMITLVDRPPVGAAVLAGLRAAFEACGGGDLGRGAGIRRTAWASVSGRTRDDRGLPEGPGHFHRKRS